MPGQSKFAEFQFIEIGHWPISGHMERNRIYSLTSFKNFTQDVRLGANADLVNYYKSINRFDATFRDHVHKTGSTSGYEGLHVADAAIIEQDHPNKIIGAAKFLFEYTLPVLESYGIDKKQLLIDPSGQKGFHIEIPAGLFAPEPHPKFYQIHREFVEQLLFGLPKDSIGAGRIVDTSIYQINRLLRMRGTRNVDKSGQEDPLRGFKINLNGNLEILRDNPENVYDLWKEPNNEGLSEDHLTGAWYWRFDPIPRLVDLWREAQSKVENIGKTKVFVPASSKNFRSRKNVKLDMPPCIRALQDKMIANDPELKQYHNHAVCALASYYAQVFPDAHVHTMVSAVAKNVLHTSFDQAEVTTSINSMLVGNDEGAKYPLGCGRDRGFPPNLFKWCSDSGELKDCPHHKEIESKRSTNLISIADAKDEALKDLDAGPSPYTWGLPELDNFYGPLMENDKVFVQAYPSVGKSRLLLNWLEAFAPIAKRQGDILLPITPEDKPKKTAKKLILRQGQLFAKDLYEKGSQAVSENVLNWFEEYRETIYTWKVSKYTVGEMSEAIDQAQQITGKRVAVVMYDGVTFFRSENRQARILEADIAQELARIISEKDYVRGIFAVHLAKETGKKARETGKEETTVRGGLNAAYGTMMYAALSQLLISMYKESGFVMLGCEKAKERWDGQINMLEPIPMAEDRFFRLHTIEAAKLLPLHWFEIDPRNAPVQDRPKRPKDFNLPKIL